MTEFVYDGLRRLRVRKEYDWKNSAWVPIKEVRYVYDGKLVIQERDALNLPQVTYTRGLDLSGSLQGAGGIGGLLARTEASGNLQQSTAYYHADGNGNITALIDAQQDVVAKYQYDPFGTLISSTGPKASANVYRFSSKEMHAASSLYYFGYRFYEPKLQRWINRDPLGEEGGINLYGFVRNSPLMRIDPFGESDFNRPPALIIQDTGMTSARYGPPAYEPGLRGMDYDPQRLVQRLVDARDFASGLMDAAEYYLRYGLLPEEMNDKIYDIQAYLSRSLPGAENVVTGYPPPIGPVRCKVKMPKPGTFGQLHHLISTKVHRALEQHPSLKGKYQARDPRFVVRAKDLESHKGYQRWHRNVDAEVSLWIRSHPSATPVQFEQYLQGRYNAGDLLDRFPQAP